MIVTHFCKVNGLSTAVSELIIKPDQAHELDYSCILFASHKHTMCNQKNAQIINVWNMNSTSEAPFTPLFGHYLLTYQR